MSLERTTTTIKLKADEGSGLYYTVALEDVGLGIIIPEPDPDSAVAGTSDAYAPIRCEDDNQIYRWSLTDSSILTHRIILSPDQDEEDVRVDLLLEDEWYQVKVILQDDGTGEMIPVLTTGPGEPWSEVAAEEPTIGAGTYLSFDEANNFLHFVA